MFSFTLKLSAASLYLRRRRMEGEKEGLALPALPICCPFISFSCFSFFVFSFFFTHLAAAPPHHPTLKASSLPLPPFLPPILQSGCTQWTRGIFSPSLSSLPLIQARSPERLLDQIGLIKATLLTRHYFPLSSSIAARLLGSHCKPGEWGEEGHKATPCCSAAPH